MQGIPDYKYDDKCKFRGSKEQRRDHEIKQGKEIALM